MQMESQKSTNRHSKEVQDIISGQSGWLLNWGIASIITIFVLMIFIANNVYYPEKKTLKIIFKLIPDLQTVSSNETIVIEHIFIHDNQIIQKGQPILDAVYHSRRVNIFAPVLGRVVLNKSLSVGETIKGKQILCYIKSSTSKILGEIQIPVNLLGQVRSGQRVLIRQINKPFSDKNVPWGTVIVMPKISIFDKEQVAKVVFDKENTRNLLVTIVPENKNNGIAEMVVHKQTLLSKIVNELISSK